MYHSNFYCIKLYVMTIFVVISQVIRNSPLTLFDTAKSDLLILKKVGLNFGIIIIKNFDFLITPFPEICPKSWLSFWNFCSLTTFRV